MDIPTARFNAVIAWIIVLSTSGITLAQTPRAASDSASTGLQQSSVRELASLRSEIVYSQPVGPRVAPQAVESEQRSVLLALGLSAVVPGGGQVYNEHWIKAGVGMALEVLFWTGYLRWKQQGNDKRAAYRSYAHEHYDPVRYAEWLNGYAGYEGDPIPTSEVDGAVDMSNPDSWSSEEERLVRQLFDDIQAAERQSHFVEPPNAAFSHELPHFGEQQYYELIGKYYQYAPGWNDCGAECTIYDPSDRFFAYAELHGTANTLLRRASRVTALIIVNHSLAALDAAITAQLHNNSLESEMTIRPGPDGRLRPHVTMAFQF